MKRVLISDSLADYLAGESLPDDVNAELFGSDNLPAGD